jgi:hypothetical protein
MSKAHDVNEQTARDMMAARKATTISVEEARNYLYSKLAALPRNVGFMNARPFIASAKDFEARDKIVQVLQNDPTFDKTHR